MNVPEGLFAHLGGVHEELSLQLLGGDEEVVFDVLHRLLPCEAIA